MRYIHTVCYTVKQNRLNSLHQHLRVLQQLPKEINVTFVIVVMYDHENEINHELFKDLQSKDVKLEILWHSQSIMACI